MGEHPSWAAASAWLRSSHRTRRRTWRSAGLRICHGRVHVRAQRPKAPRRAGRMCRSLAQALVEPEPPCSRATVVSHQAPGDAEQPQPVVGWGRYDVEAAPGDQEDLGDQVSGVVFAHSPAQVSGDRLAMGDIEVLEPARAAHVEFVLWHPGPLRPFSLTELYGRHNPKTVAAGRGRGRRPVQHRGASCCAQLVVVRPRDSEWA